jgi:hypothetical protein
MDGAWFGFAGLTGFALDAAWDDCAGGGGG